MPCDRGSCPSRPATTGDLSRMSSSCSTLPQIRPTKPGVTLWHGASSPREMSMLRMWAAHQPILQLVPLSRPSIVMPGLGSSESQHVARENAIGQREALSRDNCIGPRPKIGFSALPLPIRHETTTTIPGNPGVPSAQEKLERSKASVHAEVHQAARYRTRCRPFPPAIGQAALRKMCHRLPASV